MEDGGNNNAGGNANGQGQGNQAQGGQGNQNGQGGQNGQGQNGEGASVPSYRLREETSLKNKALARVGALEQELEQANQRASGSDALAKEIERLKNQHKADKLAWDEERSLFGAGLTDPEAIGLARHFHGALPEKDRPGLPDWIKGLREDPSKAPKGLAPYLPAPTSNGGHGGNGTRRTSTSTRDTRVTPATGIGADPAVTPERVRAAHDEAKRTGDWSTYRELRGLKR